MAGSVRPVIAKALGCCKWGHKTFPEGSRLKSATAGKLLENEGKTKAPDILLRGAWLGA